MPRQTHRLHSLVLSFVFVFAAQLRAQTGGEVGEDWPWFLGPTRNNVSAETNLFQKWSEAGPKIIWERAVGSGYSAPSVLGTRLVLHHRIKNDEVVECFDAAKGGSLWRNSLASEFSDPYGYNNGPRCTPILFSNRCYTFGAGGRLCCLELETGKMVWQEDTAKRWRVPEPFFGVGSTPFLEGDKLIVMVGGQPDATLVAFDRFNGKVLWQSGGKSNWEGVATVGWRGEAPYHWTGEEKLASYSSPIGATIHGRRHVLCFTRQGLMSVNPTNGSIYFSRWFQSQVNESVNAMTPIIREDEVLISGAYYRVGAVLLRILDDGSSLREVWRSPRSSAERDPESGALASPVLELHWNTPVLHNGYLYAFSGRNEPDATFRCVEFETGKLMWSRDERWRPHSASQPFVYGRGSAILADGRLIVLGEGGKLGLFALNPRRPEEIWSGQVPQLHYPCWTAPVLARKRLYLRSEDRLICIDAARD